MYTKMIQRGVLGLAVIMFVALFAAQVQAAFSNAPSGTLLVGGKFQSNFTVKDFRGKDVPIVNRSFTVLRGLPFTISWDAKGEEAGTGGATLTSTGVNCANDWSTNTSASGSDTGILTSGRTFLMTCSGLGAGIVSPRTAKIGVVNLIVSDISLQLATVNGKYTVGTYTLSATVKNTGTMPVDIPFKVTYVRAPSQQMLDSFNPLAVRTVDAVTAPAVSMSVAPFSAVTGTGEWWFKVCADTENAVPETSDTDNCKILGPINVVTATN